jgi:L-asparaginase
MLTLEEVHLLAAQARTQLARRHVATVIVTIGTAVIEEVGYFLDLVVDSRKPVVLTGAMLDTSRLGFDGGRNLFDSVRVGLSTEFAGQGVLVCLGGEVHAARSAEKLHNTSLAPIVSWPNGPLGLADIDRVARVRSASGRQHLGPVLPSETIELVKATLGCSGRQLASAIAAGAAGIVVEGFPGGGGVTAAMMEEVLHAIEAEIPVVVVSRAPFGRGVAAARGGSGPADLAAAGAIVAENLSACKARVLLMCALARTQKAPELRAIFAAAEPVT